MTLQVKYAVCLCVMCMAVFRVGNGMEYKFKYYTDNNGLSSNTIQCLYQPGKYVFFISD